MAYTYAINVSHDVSNARGGKCNPMIRIHIQFRMNQAYLEGSRQRMTCVQIA